MQQYESNPKFDVFVHPDGNVVIIADRSHASVLFEAWNAGQHIVMPAEGLLEKHDVGQESIDRVVQRMEFAEQAHSNEEDYASPLE